MENLSGARHSRKVSFYESIRSFEFFFIVYILKGLFGNVAKRCPDTVMSTTIRKSHYRNGLIVFRHTMAAHQNKPKRPKVRDTLLNAYVHLIFRNVFLDEVRPTSQTSKLKGPNPLESYLKSD